MAVFAGVTERETLTVPRGTVLLSISWDTLKVRIQGFTDDVSGLGPNISEK